MRARTKTVASLLGLTVALGACEDSPVLPEISSLVVQAYLYTGQPVESVMVSRAVPLSADDQSLELVSDAQISLFRGDQRFDLIPTPGEAGRYHYPGDVPIEPGDVFELVVTHESAEARATTTVPSPPAGLSLSAGSMEIVEIGSGPGFGRPRGGLQGVTNGITARWANPSRDFHFLTIDNVDPNPEALPTSEFRNRLPVRFVTQPVTVDSTVIQQLQLTHFGAHRILLYRVNQEYADLYSGRTQDTRDLNEPASNIVGGLGVFSAFAADSVFFTASLGEG